MNVFDNNKYYLSISMYLLARLRGNCYSKVFIAMLTLTGSHSATCRSLTRLKPVVRIFSPETNTALTGLEPS